MDTYKRLCSILLSYTMPYKQQNASASAIEKPAIMKLHTHRLPLA